MHQKSRCLLGTFGQTIQASFHSPSPLYTGDAEKDGDLQCKFCTRALTRVSSLEQTAVAKSFLGGAVRCNY